MAAVVVSVVMVVGSEVTLVALVTTRGDLALDLTRVEMEGSPMEEGEGMRRNGTNMAQICDNRPLRDKRKKTLSNQLKLICYA